MSRRSQGAALAALTLILGPGCFYLLAGQGGGQRVEVERRLLDPADVVVPEGYRVELFTYGLTFLTRLGFDDEGRPYVVEAGFSYGEEYTVPRLLRIEPDGSTVVIAEGRPEDTLWTGLAFHDGAFFIAAGGLEGGRVLRVSLDGEVHSIVEGLPGHGDHHRNGPVLGPDGMLYFGQGTATNSGVVGADNFDFGWPRFRPRYHDIPCEDIRLAGVNYRTPNFFTEEEGDFVLTGAFHPFGEPSRAGEVVSGQMPCTGSILRVSPEGGDVELVAWGFRNPFGLAFSPDGRLFVTDNGYDVRGRRPVFGSADWLWEVRPGLWHGWPDFAGGRPVWDARYDRLGIPRPRSLLAELPNPPPEPAAFFGAHSSSNGLAFSTSPAFGFVG